MHSERSIVISALFIAFALTATAGSNAQSGADTISWAGLWELELGGLVAWHYGDCDPSLSLGAHIGLDFPVVRWSDSSRFFAVRGVLELGALFATLGLDVKVFLHDGWYLAPGYRWSGHATVGASNSCSEDDPGAGPGRLSLAAGYDSGKGFIELLYMKTLRRQYFHHGLYPPTSSILSSLVLTFGWVL